MRALFFLLAAAQALAWYEGAHRAIAQAAVEACPGRLGKELRAHLPLVLECSVRPDQWRGFSGLSHGSVAPEHYVNLERVARNPVKVDFPEDRYAFLLMVGRPPEDVGFLPYAIAEHWDRLAVALRRVDREPSVYAEAAVWAGVLSHFVSDATVPLHASIYHDGRPRRGWFGGRMECVGIHGRLEGGVGEALLGTFRILPPDAAPERVEDPLQVAVVLVKESWTLVPLVYRLDEEGRLRPDDEEAASLVRDRFTRGAQVLLDLLWSAAPLDVAAADEYPVAGVVP